MHIDCYELPEISKTMLIGIFMAINSIIEPERKKLSDKNRWSVMTMFFDSDGSFESDFDYTDISEKLISYQAEWEKSILMPS